MKKISTIVLAVLMVVCVAVTFAACSSKEYVDVVVTQPVTDESGEQVTDENGVGVTEVVTDQNGEAVTTSVKKEETATAATQDSTQAQKPSDDKNDKSTEKSDKSEKETTDKKASTSKKNTSDKDKTTKKDKTEKDTTKKETTTKPTTTEAPKKREVTAVVYLPNKALAESRLTIKYRVKDGNKEWSEWKKAEFDDPDNKHNKLDYKVVVLDGKTAVECKLGKIKGIVNVKCELTRYELSDNFAKSDAYQEIIELHPYSGIEDIEGVDD